MKIQSLLELYSLLPENELLILDVLRELIIDHLGSEVKEKISYNVPYFYSKKGICIIWPSTVPRGGINEGVLLGFWYGYKLNDVNDYLIKGNNKQIFYKIFTDVDQIDEVAIKLLLDEAIALDRTSSSKLKKPKKL